MPKRPRRKSPTRPLGELTPERYLCATIAPTATGIGVDRHESNRCGQRCGDRRPSKATSLDTSVGRDSRHRRVARRIANRASRQLHGPTIATRRDELERLRGSHVDVHLLRSFQRDDRIRRNESGTCTERQRNDSDDHVLRTHVHPLRLVGEGDARGLPQDARPSHASRTRFAWRVRFAWRNVATRNQIAR